MALLCVFLPAARAAADGKPTATFVEQVQPLLQEKCLKCHNSKARKANLDLSTPAGIVKGGESGPVIVPGKPDESTLFEKIHEGEMPPAKKDKLSDSQVQVIKRWIESGADIGSADGSWKAGTTAHATVTQHDVIPIVLRRCTGCHGARQTEAGLDLRTRASMLRGGKSGPAIVVGKPEESLLIKKVSAAKMPPPDKLVEGSVKPIEAAEIEVLARWIALGAPEVSAEPDVATTSPDPLVTDKDRDFWAFQPPRAAKVPHVTHNSQVRGPIDAFVLEKLEAKGLALGPEADRLTLLRRAYFDLTGLPPDPAEVEDFLRDDRPEAYEALIDRLLASPRYGERWGRFWLDLAGYADSEGKREQDLPRPNAWRYRDYVIHSFNSDKPYDRFVLEQIAGDELADYEHAPEITPELYDNLVATGFLRMAPDATWANITGYAPDRIDVIADEIDVLGSAVMGLTLKCARCHSHKFDPIPQRDYYRLADVFKGALDEYDWLKPDVRPGLGPVSSDIRPGRLLPYVTSTERRAWEARNAMIEKDVAALRAQIEREREARAAKYVDQKLTETPEVLRADVRLMLATPAAKRSVVQKYLAEKFEKMLRIDGDALKALDPLYAKRIDELDRQVRAREGQKEPEPKIQALWDRGDPSPTYLYRRGDWLNPGPQVGPGVPSVLTDGKTPFDVKPPWPGAKKTGRRLAFARWLTRPEHPLTARVAVNRIWKHHFGTGIVRSLANFGKAGTPPTHPELLDWLAREFMATGWSLKKLHRAIMTSATYRQSSAVTAERARLDPENVLYSRMPLVRLDAEALYDTLLAVAGRLDETRFGPSDPVETHADGLVTPVGTPRGWRRLIYVRQSRKQILTHAENFDYPPMNPNCIERRDSIVALQALQMMNAAMVQNLAEAFARRARAEAGPDLAAQVKRVYLIALSRPPTADELTLGIETLPKLAERWTKSAGNDAADRALATYCHALMNSAGFLYVD
jgi:hypothetical protein